MSRIMRGAYKAGCNSRVVVFVPLMSLLLLTSLLFFLVFLAYKAFRIPAKAIGGFAANFGRGLVGASSYRSRRLNRGLTLNAAWRLIRRDITQLLTWLADGGPIPRGILATTLNTRTSEVLLAALVAILVILVLNGYLERYMYR